MHFETSSSTKVYVENTERVVLLKNEMAIIVYQLIEFIFWRPWNKQKVNTEIVGFFKEAISEN